MYDMMPPQPAQPVPQVRKRMSVPQIMLIVAALGFLAWYLVTVLFPDQPQTATITRESVGEHYSGDCLIIRNETPYDAESVTTVDYVAEEGSAISMGTIICNVYSSGYSTREMTALQDYRDEIKKRQLELLGKEITTDAELTKLENEVMTQAREVRDIIHGARGNMMNQEKQLNTAIQARQSFLKDKFSNDQRMTRLYDDEQSQLQRINSWTKQYAALNAGIVSFYSDGYEYGLTIHNFEEFTPSEVRKMIDGKKYRGYLEADGNPVEGAVYELRLENFKSTTVYAKVLSYTRTGGELLIRLSVENTSVMPVLYMRTCTGELGDSATSLAVPEKAIYTQNNQQGVVRVEGESKWFVQVTILKKQDGLCYIAPIQPGALEEGQTVKLF